MNNFTKILTELCATGSKQINENTAKDAVANVEKLFLDYTQEVAKNIIDTLNSYAASDTEQNKISENWEDEYKKKGKNGFEVYYIPKGDVAKFAKKIAYGAVSKSVSGALAKLRIGIDSK